MTDVESPCQEPAYSFDQIALDLQDLREESGPISYADLVRRIAKLRLARGLNPVAATPARSTVYNAFCTGRTRMDTELIADIVVALGVSMQDSELWVSRCRDARREFESAAKVKRQVPSPAEPEDHKAMATVLEATGPSARLVILFMVLAVLVNHGLHRHVVVPLNLPLYLDMLGTATVSMMLGPWCGVIVAVVTGVTASMMEQGILAFTLVNVVGALTWGYGIRKFGLGRNIARFFFLNLLVATACTFVATPILVFLRGGAYGSIGEIAATFQEAGLSLQAATFASNFTTSILDKLLTGFVAISLFALLHARAKVSAEHAPLVGHLSAKEVGAVSALPPPSWAASEMLRGS